MKKEKLSEKASIPRVLLDMHLATFQLAEHGKSFLSFSFGSSPVVSLIIVSNLFLDLVLYCT